jgi:hypothetical protein
MAKVDIRNLDIYSDETPKEKMQKGKRFKEDDSKKKK